MRAQSDDVPKAVGTRIGSLFQSVLLNRAPETGAKIPSKTSICGSVSGLYQHGYLALLARKAGILGALAARAGDLQHCMEARPGIEPGCEDLQSSTSPLRHRAAHGGALLAAVGASASERSGRAQARGRVARKRAGGASASERSGHAQARGRVSAVGESLGGNKKSARTEVRADFSRLLLVSVAP